jgi:hypothetical protein
MPLLPHLPQVGRLSLRDERRWAPAAWHFELDAELTAAALAGEAHRRDHIRRAEPDATETVACRMIETLRHSECRAK